MQRIEIAQLYSEHKKYLDTDITVAGWLRSARVSKDFGFLEINDGSHFNGMQIVFDQKLSNFDQISKLNVGSSIYAEGILVPSQGSKQEFELQAKSIHIFNMAEADYPLQKKRHSFEFLRTMPHLRSRSNTFRAIFRLRSILAQSIHDFFQKRNFVYIHTPIITASDCEGAGELFRVTTLDGKDFEKNNFEKDFFKSETHLTVSGQLELEAFALALGKVYTFGPTFRAENSNTARHAAEFWMIEPEIAFADLNDDMLLAESMIKKIIKDCLDKAAVEIDFFDQFIEKGILQKLTQVEKASFEKISYTEAIKILEKAEQPFEYKAEWGVDLQTEHERYLCENYFQSPVFVTDYPKTIKPFYMKLNDDDKTVRAMDLLVPSVGEIIGGSQREDDYSLLEKRMLAQNLSIKDYQWYLDLRRYGSCPHAGFGLGFERALMYISGMTNIRDVIPHPRTPGHCI